MVGVDEEESIESRGEQAILRQNCHSDTYANENDVGVVMELDAILGVMARFGDVSSFRMRKSLQRYTS